MKCPKSKQPLNAPVTQAPRSEEPRQDSNTKLFTGIICLTQRP